MCDIRELAAWELFNQGSQFNLPFQIQYWVNIKLFFKIK